MNKPINPKLVGIVLPAYNEAGVIGKVLDDLLAATKRISKKVDVLIIVVNDCSTDSTMTRVEKRKDIVLINHILNSGAGAATRTGLNYAKNAGCNYAITMDSDGQHSPSDVISLIEEILKNKSDFIIGSRLLQKTGNMPLAKKVGNVGLGLITFVLMGVYASDTQSGLKALNRKALENIYFHSNNYAFCSEMIWKAHQADLIIDEVPIEAIYTDYSVSRGQRNITGAIEIITQLVKRRFLSFINE